MGPFLGQVIEEYGPVISHHQSKSLMVTKSLADSDLRWDASHLAEVNENINLGYSQDQGYS